MKLFKRLTAIVLSFCIAMPAFAAEEELPVTLIDTGSEAYQVLSSLDIIKDDAEAVDKKVTRSQFANSLAMFMNEELPKGKQIYDLSASDSGLIWLIDNGKIHGDGDNIFRPNDNITLAEALKLSLSVLGYDELAKEQGGYPYGYLNVARRLNLMDIGIDRADDELMYEDYITLLYNMIYCDVMYADVYTKQGGISYITTVGKTLLTEYRDIYNNVGIVTANEMTGLYSEFDTVSKGVIGIGDDILIADKVYNTNIDYLGMKVLYFYKDDGENEPELRSIVPIKNRNLKIPRADIMYYENGVYTYTSNGSSRKKVELDNDIVIIYNNVFIEDNKVFIPENGYIELIDNNNDSIYDVLKVYDRTLLIVESTFENNGSYSILDKYDHKLNITIDITNDRSFSVYDHNGLKRSFENISSGDVVELEKSAGTKPYYKLIISSKIVNSQLAYSGEDMVGFSDNSEYKITERFKALVKTNDQDIDFDVNCTVHLTSDDKVVYIEYADTSLQPLTYRVGYLLKFGTNGNGLDPTPQVRMLDQSGSWETFDFANKVKVDGVRQDAEDINLSDKMYGLVKYMINIKGEISEMYFPAPIPTDGSNVDYDENFQTLISGNCTYRYYPSGWVIGTGSDIINTADTMAVFIVSSVDSNADLTEDLVTVTTRSIFGDGSAYNLTAYSTGDTYRVADVALVRASDTTKIIDRRNNRPLAVNKVTKVLDEEGNERYAVKGIQNGAEVKILVDDQRANQNVFPVEPGDVCYLLPDINGIVTLRDDLVIEGVSHSYSCQIICKHNDDNTINVLNTVSGDVKKAQFGIYMGSNRITESTRIVGATVYDVDSQKMYINATNNLGDWTKVEPINNISWGYIYVWNNETKTFHSGKFTEATGYKYNKNNPSKVCLVNTNEYLVTIIYP